MSFPGRPPLVPYGLAPGVVTVPMATHVMVGAYGVGAGSAVPTSLPSSVGGGGGGGGGGSRGALLPAPGKAVISRAPTRNGASQPENTPVTVFIGNISARAPDAMTRALLAACGPVLSWKRVSTFGFCEFAGVEAALRCVRVLHERHVAGRPLVARTDGKVQALVDAYKSEQRSRLPAAGAPGVPGAPGTDDYLDARQRAADEAAERRLTHVIHEYQHEVNNYHQLQKEEAISKTAKVLEEADISEEKRDVIHREIGKFRESMKKKDMSRLFTF